MQRPLQKRRVTSVRQRGTLTDLVARVRDWEIPHGLLGRYRQD